ncbi:response regulator [Butyrivibrio sp. AE3006]|uniref:response regulator n=1 Tax=Butyrivibrio sp. AE3006 TaxID=1280673 RepID=UPI0004264A9B|nr:response regulator [Butyrivibrio sp. AE3006]
MAANKMIVIGEKESFIVRVLIQKAQGAGCDTEFAHLSVDGINAKIQDVSLITLYLDDNTMPQEDVLHYLTDIMDERNLQMILIGEQIDIEQIRKHLPEELIYETFCRPVDNENFARTVADYFTKVASGEFKKSILIVDDDPQYLTLVREWLKGTYKVSMANSGLRAIKWLGKNKVDLILLDHEMPVTSGPQVLEMLRSDPETRSIPVMFLTGKGDKESVMKVVALKPEGYFLKNIDREELIEKLQEFFILHK